MQILLIPPADLRRVWPTVREGLALMPAEDWIPEDVYHLIKTGDSALYMGHGDAGYLGFFVLRRLVGEFDGSVSLHCWLAYNAGDADVFMAAESMVRQIAQQAGASRITFGSPRKGWGKRYPLVTATYSVPLENPL